MSMGFYDKHNNAAGKEPDFGAIFMTNSGTKKECFRRRVFGLPSSAIQFVEKVKAGMILFLFDYEKRQLHGVFRAACDGAINIEPNAFTSSGSHYPAQVKFTSIWFCKPLSEDEFRNIIRENYFSSKKFNFGLSENQVCKLLHLFSMRKLDPEVLGRHMTGMEDLKSEWYPGGKVGRYAVPGMVGESVQNEQVVGESSSHFLVHKYKGDYSQYDGEVGYTALNADDMGLNKQGRSADIEVDTTSRYVTDYLPLKDGRQFTAREDEHYIDHHAARLSVDTMSGHVSDYLALKDESRFTSHENNDYMDTCPRPYINDGYSKIPSDEIRYHIDGRSSISDRLMAEDLRKTDQRMVFSDDIPGLGDSNVNLPVFYRKPSLERNFLAQNHLSPTSAMSHPFQTQITQTSCAIQGDTDSILYNADAPGLNFRQLPVGVNGGSESLIESTSLSTHSRRNSLSMHMKLKDMNQWHDIGGGFPNAVMYGSNNDYMPFNEAQKSDRLGSESVLYEAGNFTPSLKSSSAPIPSDIGNSCREHETISSFFHNGKSCLGNNVHPMTFRENLSHEITLQNNNDTFNPDVPRANESHSQVQYADSFDHEYDIGCYGYSRNSNCSHPKKKSSVFSRLSLKQDVGKQKNGNNAQSEEYDYHTAVAEVMNMARRSHSQWMKKRKPKPSQCNKAESLKNENPRPSQRIKTESLKDKTLKPSQRNKAESFEDEISKPSQLNKTESLKDETPRPSQRNKAESLREKKLSSSQCNKAKSLKDKAQIVSSSRVKGECFEKVLEVPSMDTTTASGSNSNTTAEEMCFVDFKRRSKVRKHCDEIERNSNENKKSDNLVLVQQKRRKLIRPNFNNSTSLDDKGINLGASLNLQVPLSDGSNNLKDVSGSCCTLDQTESIIKTDAEVQNIISPTRSGGKNSSHAIRYICDEGGEKANNEALTALKDVPECLGKRKLIRPNFNNSTAFDDKGINLGASLNLQVPLSDGSNNLKNVSGSCCTLDQTESIIKTDAEVQNTIGPTHSEGKNSSHAMGLIKKSSHAMGLIKKSSHAMGLICDEGGEKANNEALPALKDVPECMENINHHKILSLTCKKESGHTKEGSIVTDNIKSVSLEMEPLNSTCHQEHNADKIICVDRGINTVSIEVKDGSQYLKNSGNEKASIETSCDIKDGFLLVMHSVESASPDKKSLHSTCEDNHLDKIICAGRGIGTEKGMSKDGNVSSTTKVKDGSDSLEQYGNDNAPIATREQKMA